MLTLTFAGDWPKELRETVERVLAALQDKSDVPTGTVNIKLVDDVEIERLNTQYNGNAYATDVLTFNYSEDGEADSELADIVISTETAERQAEQADTGLADEVGLLALHGLLHVLGHDHQIRGEQRAMDELQQTIMKSAGLTYREFVWKD